MNEHTVPRGRDIVCFSSIDWQFIWQGHQEIMSTFAADGHRVLFVENTGVRAASIRDLPRVRQRLLNWWRGTKGFRRERDNLFVYSPLLLPFPYSLIVRRLNRVLLTRALRRWMRAADFGRPIVWTFLPTPLVREVIPQLDPLVSIYYCIDDFASSSPGARRITVSEDQLFREADLVFVTSEKLQRRAAQFSNRVHLFPFGVSFKKFEQIRLEADPLPDDLAGLTRPVVGYVGGIHQWMDVGLLVETAKAMPNVSFALVGPLQINGDAFSETPNIYVLGKRAHDDIPRYVKGFDAAIIPYALSDYTANVYPTKLNEYLAMGVPVVTTDLPEIRRFNAEHGSSVAIAADAEEFIAALTSALSQRPDDGRARRIAIAKANSWNTRIATMSSLIDEVMESKLKRREPWEVTLRRMYRRGRGRVVGWTMILAFAYIAVFETSLPWMLAEPLRMGGTPGPADAIVVFAGGVGESGQAGGGYQERVKTAVELYQAGFAPRMILVSGYVFAFREAEVMRDLAVSLGVPESAIVLESDGSNTYEYVRNTHDLLSEGNWRRILLVSSPYHMRRAQLVWVSQAPEVNVVPTPVPDSQFYTHARGASFTQLQGLVREYLAIVYYRTKGWL
jgi:uncharacterized SAM-binding protein YcdF (DUF218 family)/glycosyltransferase involved in cell wall biosynthesis